MAVVAAPAEGGLTLTGTASEAQLLGICELKPANAPDDGPAAPSEPDAPGAPGRLVTVDTGPSSGASG